MNAQELFDIVVTHLRRQGERAFAGDACMYRAPNGARCAVGALVPLAVERGLDEEVAGYVDDYQGDVYDAFVAYPEFLDALGLGGPDDGDDSFWPTEVKLLKDLQLLHDNERNWSPAGGFNEDGEHELSRIAERYALDIPAGVA